MNTWLLCEACIQMFNYNKDDDPQDDVVKISAIKECLLKSGRLKYYLKIKTVLF